MRPLISVVIPLYNKEKSVLRAIRSVLSQVEKNFELIVVNDGSSDRSACLVEGLPTNQKIRLIHQENNGVSAARNRGVEEAESELIAFLDADDEWHPNFLRTVLELRSKFPDGRAFCTLYSIQESGKGLSLPNTSAIFAPGYRGYIENYLEVIRSILPFNSSSFAVAKEAFQVIGGFPVGIEYGEDVDTWIRLSLRYKMVYINQSLAIYHRDAENRACDLYYSSLNEYYPVKNLAQMIRKGDVPTHLKQSAIEYVAKYQLSLANSYLYYGNTKPARTLIDSCAGTRIYRKRWAYLYLCTFVPPALLKSLIKIRNTARGWFQ